MSPKHRWAATGVPALRRRLTSSCSNEAARIAELAARARHMARTGGPLAGDVVRQADDLDHASTSYTTLAERLPAAELFWVTASMSEVAMDAASDVPGIRLEDCPAANGLIVFAKALPPLSTESIGGLALRDDTRTDVPHLDPVPVDALLWMRHGTRLSVHVGCRRERLPLPLTPHDSDLVPFMEFAVELPALLGKPMPALGPQGMEADSHARGVLSLLSACWVLMMTPTVAERKSLDGKWGGSPTGQTKPEDLVTTVDLRPLRQVTVDEEAGTGRKLVTRHLVRGHWTNQPYGPGRRQRRLQWIAPYIRGPEGAPLIQREQVNVWRR